MNVESKLNRRKTMTEILEAASVANIVSMREETIVIKEGPTASSTLSKDGSPAIKRLFEAVAHICGLYEVYLRNLVRQHELSAGEDISGNVDFVLVDLSYNV